MFSLEVVFSRQQFFRNDIGKFGRLQNQCALCLMVFPNLESHARSQYQQTCKAEQCSDDLPDLLLLKDHSNPSEHDRENKTNNRDRQPESSPDQGPQPARIHTKRLMHALVTRRALVLPLRLAELV